MATNCRAIHSASIAICDRFLEDPKASDGARANQAYCASEVPVRELLVVDDSKVMRDMIVACLRADPALSFTHASSGLEAIEQLSLRSYALVVLDLNMPDIGGIEVIEFVRGQDKLRALPILVVTTRGDDDSRNNVLAAGASQYMTKPFAPDAILGAVLALLGSRGSG